MDFKLIVLLVACFIGQIVGWPYSRSEICYDIGCFAKDQNGKTPYSPEYINTKFYLTTRNTDDYEELIVTNDHQNCSWTSFCNGTKRVIVIVHGYRSYVHGTWVENMAKELLVHDDYNVIMVDWKKGAEGSWWWFNEDSQYHQVEANARLVGAQLAQLIDVFKNVYNIDHSNMHIIGHSLGAHVADIVGNMTSISRIIDLEGLDPDEIHTAIVDVTHADMEENELERDMNSLPTPGKSNPSEICYDIGCFAKDLNGKTPYSPEYIGTKFYLTTRNTDDYEELIVTNDHQNCSWKSFCNGTKRVIVIVHGYRSYVHGTWVENMAKELLVHDEYNVIMVDWKNGAAGSRIKFFERSQYKQAVANSRVVGAQLAQLLDVLKNVYNIDPSNMHIIGHSLGSHVAGIAGNTTSIGRISGLDPAVHEFDDKSTHLDETDASFVDVIHTDMKDGWINLDDFGTSKASGTVDFFPNEGRDQPGCEDIFEYSIGCSHLRAVDYFMESINSKCHFTAYPSQQNNTCGPTGCGVMGFHTSPSISPGNYSLTTNYIAPYCLK